MQQKRYLVALRSGFAIAQVQVTVSCGKVNYFRVRRDLGVIGKRQGEDLELHHPIYRSHQLFDFVSYECEVSLTYGPRLSKRRLLQITLVSNYVSTSDD
jgi:hypothetical protein